MNAYQVLGIDADADERTIKRAYAALIKQYRPDTHPVEFAQVRTAYENVLHWFRENRHWEEQQQAEDNMARPIEDVPMAPETPVAKPASELQIESESGQPAVNQRNLIQEQLAQLEEVATRGNEQATLAKYREQSALMAVQNMDLQLEYEQALLYWVLATQHPSLLVFAEANKRFDWLSDSIAICRSYGEYAGYRLAAMERLAAMLAATSQERNPFLRLEGEHPPRSVLLTDHYIVQRAEELGRAWRNECGNAGLEQLSQRLIYQPPRPAQMYWVDIVIGLAATGYGWLFVGNDPMPKAAIEALMIGIGFLFMPVCMRVIIDALDKKFGARARQIKANMSVAKWFAAGLGFYVILIIVGPSFLIYIMGFTSIFIFARWGYDVLSRIEASLVKAGWGMARKSLGLISAIVRTVMKRSTERHYLAYPRVIEKPLWLRGRDKVFQYFKPRRNVPPRWVIILAVLLLIRFFTR